MEPLAFTLSVALLLATPGPTNSLLAAAGALQGARASWRLPLAEISGYALSIAVLSQALGPWIARDPLIGLAIRLLACLWLGGCALSLWRQPDGETRLDRAAVSPRRVFLTTLINPKGLLFATTLFPVGGLATLAPWFGGFAAVALPIAWGWILVGTGLARAAGTAATPRRIRRLAALGLAGFAVMVGGSALAAML